jgi:predicted glycogen debranching enzyme
VKAIFSRSNGKAFNEDDLRKILDAEWLVTNGLGGYASCSISGTLRRVFHGYLIAALPAPLGRTMMLNDIREEVVLGDDTRVVLHGQLTLTSDERNYAKHLSRFHLESGLPVWTYEFNGITLEKRIVLPCRQNTTYVSYRLTKGSGPVKLLLRPFVNMREHEAPVNSPIEDYTTTIRKDHYELKSEGDIPALRLRILGDETSFSVDACRISDVVYEIERHRGYTWHGDLWSPGYFSVALEESKEATLVASTENWPVIQSLSAKQAWDAEHDRKTRLLREANPRACGGPAEELVWAADQFIFSPVGRQADTARARAAGDEIRSVIAGYPWFTDWGRDTMISLEGLTLATGRATEAGYILRTFAHSIKDGLIPNMFPEGKTEGLYHTADATLWFFHACQRYLQLTGDKQLLSSLLPHFIDIVDHHLRGTKFNIHVDHSDGLLVQGQEGYQLTWMDAKVEGWVVTPRRGKAVEINALWYNALRLLEGWLCEAGRDQEARAIGDHARQAQVSFNKRFWNADRGYLYDVVDGEKGDDPSCRPNQVFALSLDHPILEQNRWEPVLKVVKDKLWTPVGLRSLAPGEPDFKAKYDGDLRSRDAAYHQGTVWAWLMGPFIDAWLRVNPNDLATARGFLSGFESQMSQGPCVGSIGEIFDAEQPFAPRGCCAQAWSVAEVLRSYINTAPAK